MASDSARALHNRAQARGRALRVELLTRYGDLYGYHELPPPALVVDEIITDVLEAELRYLPIHDDRFAQTQLIGGRVVVTVNTLTAAMGNVKYPELVQNVGKWHEVVHVVDDQRALERGPQLTFRALGEPAPLACYRRRVVAGTPDAFKREVGAEEAGRAAAVSYPHLFQSRAFRELIELGERRVGRPLGGAGWQLLNASAEAIYVNPRRSRRSFGGTAGSPSIGRVTGRS